jgi:P2 family phage contractile tail tube protein
MALPKVLKDYTAFADGYGYLGKVPELEPPKLVKKMEEYIGGGMAAPVDIFMGEVEKMTASMTLAEYDPQNIKLFGFTNGNEVAITFRGVMEGGGDTWPVIINMRGEYQELDLGSWKKGENVQLKASFSLSYVKITINDEELFEVDAANGILIVGGKDLRAAINSALGV